MKQPKYFYKSSSETQGTHKIPVPTLIRPTDDQVIQPPNALPANIHIPTHFLFGIGFASLSLLTVLSLFPKLGVYWQPTLLSLRRADNAPVVLEQKGTTGISNGLQFDARTADARIEIISGFLTRYHSPLHPTDKYARVLVETADRYNLDYRLLPAIMMQESNLCKASDPSIHNCLGFGIHKRGTLAFDSYEESFDRAARELKERYIDQGLVTPEQIMTKYTPSSNGSWANSVNQWIAEMEFNSRDKGRESTLDFDLTAYSKR